MELTSLTIKKFKSIQLDLTIDLTNRFITVIGKNGSGKTNILNAVWFFFNAFDERHRYSNQQKVDFSCQIKMSNSEFNKYRNDLALDSNSKYITLYFYEHDPRNIYIESSILTLNIQRFKERAVTIRESLGNALDEYIKALEFIEYEKTDSTVEILEAYDIKEGNSFTNRYSYSVKYMKQTADDIIKKINEYINTNFKDNLLKISKDSYFPHHYHQELFKFHSISYKEIILSPLLKQCVTIDNEKYKKLVEETAKTLEDNHKLVNDEINKFNTLTGEVEKLVMKKVDDVWNKNERKEKIANTFIQELEQIIRKRAILLDNENSILFKPRNDYQRYNDNNYLGFNPILVSIEEYCRNNNVLNEDESFEKINEIGDKRKKAIIQSINNYLKEITPVFDKDKIDSLVASFTENTLELSLKELNGNIVSLDETSLGRRWYLSYMFVKNSLNKNDVFIIDEPASFLHPSAQQEVLKELEELSKKHLIIISTHSPYMLSKESSIYYDTDMSINGTVVKALPHDDLFKIKESIGFTEYTNILFDSTKKHILVEGERDVVCIRRFMKMLKVNETDYNIFACDGYNMPTITRFLESYNKDFIALIDADHKDETTKERLLAKKKQYSETLANSDYFISFIKKAISEPRRYYFIGENTAELSMEGLFSDNDKRRNFTRIGNIDKIDINKVRDRKNFDNITIDNFKNLFKEIGIS